MSTYTNAKTFIGYEFKKEELYDLAKTVFDEEYMKENDGYDGIIAEDIANDLGVGFNQDSEWDTFVFGFEFEESYKSTELIKIIERETQKLKNKFNKEEEPSLHTVTQVY